jgi:hypothetical protein
MYVDYCLKDEKCQPYLKDLQELDEYVKKSFKILSLILKSLEANNVKITLNIIFCYEYDPELFITLDKDYLNDLNLVKEITFKQELKELITLKMNFSFKIFIFKNRKFMELHEGLDICENYYNAYLSKIYKSDGLEYLLKYIKKQYLNKFVKELTGSVSFKIIDFNE